MPILPQKLLLLVLGNPKSTRNYFVGNEAQLCWISKWMEMEGTWEITHSSFALCGEIWIAVSSAIQPLSPHPCMCMKRSQFQIAYQWDESGSGYFTCNLLQGQQWNLNLEGLNSFVFSFFFLNTIPSQVNGNFTIKFNGDRIRFHYYLLCLWRNYL